MTLDSYTIDFISPDIDEFIQLRIRVGWGELDRVMALFSLQNTLFHVCVRDNSQLIGMGRIIGDGVMYFYIQDVAVDPGYQKKGVGTAVMQQIENHLNRVAKPGSTIGLLAAKDKENFYSKYGYITRPDMTLGSGMCRFV